MNGIQICFSGRVGGEPEGRYTSSGKRMLTFSVAVDENQRQTSERQDPVATRWIRVTLWEDLADRLQDQIKKGTPLLVEGSHKLDRWTGKDGEQRVAESVSAWRCEPLQLTKRSRPNGEGGRDREPVGDAADDEGALPF